MEGKAVFNLSDNPLFIDPLILTTLVNPGKVKCSLFLTILNDCFQVSNTSRFVVIKGYFSK
jgi:hypothetical protein